MPGLGGPESSGSVPVHLETSAYGTIVRVEALEGPLHRFVLDADAVDCERNETRWSLDAHVPGSPVDVNDSEQGFVFFASIDEPGNWTLRTTYAGYEEYVDSCSGRHERDVRVASPSAYTTSGGTSAVSLHGQPLVLGEPSFIRLDLQNAQDDAIDVLVRNLTLVNEEAYVHVRTGSAKMPPETARAELSRIVGCSIEPRDHAVTIPANTTHALTLHIACPEDADATPVYRTCQEAHWTPGPAGGEAQRVEGSCETKEPFSPHVGVWGNLSFTDELGRVHTYADILRQGYHLAREARLAFDAPERVETRDEFVLRGTYTDATGRGVPGGGVDVQLDYPGLENHRFAASYDNLTGEYRFEWDDMMEWRPWLWREGAHDVTVRAQDHDDQEHLPRTSRATVIFE